MSTLYTNLGELHNIDDGEWAAFKEALTIYYSWLGRVILRAREAR